MYNTLKIGVRNLIRYKRRTLLSSTLIVVAITFLFLFIGVISSFKKSMIGIITDNLLGHIQIHRSEYMKALNAMPLNYDIENARRDEIIRKIKSYQEVEAVTSRVIFNGLISTYNESTSVKIVGVDPHSELLVCPGLRTRVSKADFNNGLVGLNSIIITKQLAVAMNIRLGDSIVIVATNKNGSVNALNLKVEGFLDSPQRIVFMHLNNVNTLLRTDTITEIVLRMKNFDNLAVNKKEISNLLNNTSLDVSLWSDISPFATIATIIDLMYIFLVVLLVSVIVVSVTNVMLMAVYERTKEIGTLLAIGTSPFRIMMMFYVESAFLGLFSAILGSAVGLTVIGILRLLKPKVNFRDTVLYIIPKVGAFDVFLILIIVVLFTIAATIIPARKAKKLEPIEALRFN
jgi:putative ABC transport system permease protein